MAQRVLTRDGEIISLTPKATEILVRLVVNAGQLLEKDDLLKEVWPDTFVEEANLTQNIFTLRRALGDERAGPRYIETVSRRGYRFVADVRVCEGDAQASTAIEAPAETPASENEEVALPRPVVAVLPFFNDTGDEGLEYLAEGLTDNIINNLSRVSRLRVMSRSAVFRRNVRAIDPQNIGKDLGATVVLVGKITSRPAAPGGAVTDAGDMTRLGANELTTAGAIELTSLGASGFTNPGALDVTKSGAVTLGPGVTPSRARAEARAKTSRTDDVEAVAEGKAVAESNTTAQSQTAAQSQTVAQSKAVAESEAVAEGEAHADSNVTAAYPRRKRSPKRRVEPGGGVRAVLVISVELVEVATGWQLWGESFDCASKDLLQIQDAITRQLLVNLKLKLTGEEEKRVTARYTESAEAYQSYLEGRYHWSRYTRKGIEKAIKHFRRAIELDSNYALSYAAIVDCYLRLATNYLPPEENVYGAAKDPASNLGVFTDDPPEQRIKLRFKWDWKGVERELRRASELKTHYPSIYQWHVAYQMSKQLCGEVLRGKRSRNATKAKWKLDSTLAPQIPSINLTPAEEVQILCSIARDQMAIGNYEAASLILRDWTALGKWPQLEYLNAYAAADLLFTSGTLFGFIAGSKPILHGHRHAEALLNGSVALFEHLGIKTRAVEARIELTRCYYRQGLLDLARQTGSAALSEVPEDEMELKTLALITLGVVERDSGRLNASLIRLREAASVEIAGCLITGRCHIDLATTLKDLALLEGNDGYLTEAKRHFLKALYESEALGHHRNVASVENNIGFLLLNLRSYRESESHLLRARRVFDGLKDTIREAQVNDTLARLYMEIELHGQAEAAIDSAVASLELTDSEALLVEALTTKGIVASKLGNFGQARRSFEAAQKVAERCGDYQGACRALLGMSEELSGYLKVDEISKIADELTRLLPTIEQPSLSDRIRKGLARITSLPADNP